MAATGFEPIATWLSVRLRTKWLWFWIPLLTRKLQIWHLLRARSCLTSREIIKYRFTLKLERDMIISYSHWKLCFVEKSLQIFKKHEVGFRILSFFWDVSENNIMVFNNENNDFNPLTAYYFSFMVHLLMFIVFLIHICLFYFRFIFSTNLL